MKSPLYVLLFAVILIFTACNKDEAEENLESRSYPLIAVGNSNITGVVTFSENSNSTTTILLELNDASKNQIFPADICMNSAAEGGPSVITLNSVDCDCINSTTIVAALDNRSTITFDELIAFDGHINVYLSPDDMDIIVAQGNIGANAN